MKLFQSRFVHLKAEMSPDDVSKKQIDSRERINRRKKRTRQVVMIIPACVAGALLAGGIVGSFGAIILSEKLFYWGVKICNGG